MLFYVLLVLLFVAVFCFLAWRIVSAQAGVKQKADDDYVCPVCNERHCECRWKTPSE